MENITREAVYIAVLINLAGHALWLVLSKVWGPVSGRVSKRLAAADERWSAHGARVESDPHLQVMLAFEERRLVTGVTVYAGVGLLHLVIAVIETGLWRAWFAVVGIFLWTAALSTGLVWMRRAEILGRIQKKSRTKE